jgi:hypothetical protein
MTSSTSQSRIETIDIQSIVPVCVFGVTHGGYFSAMQADI